MSLSVKCFSQHWPGTVWPNMTRCLYVLLWLCYISVSTFGLRTLTRVKGVILSGNYSYLLASFFDQVFDSIFNCILFQFVIYIFSFFIIIIISSSSIFNLFDIVRIFDIWPNILFYLFIYTHLNHSHLVGLLFNQTYFIFHHSQSKTVRHQCGLKCAYCFLSCI